MLSFSQTALFQTSDDICQKEFHTIYHYLNTFLRMKILAIRSSIKTAKWTNRDKQVFLQIFLQCLSVGRRCDGQICVRFCSNLTGVFTPFAHPWFQIIHTGIIYTLQVVCTGQCEVAFLTNKTKLCQVPNQIKHVLYVFLCRYNARYVDLTYQRNKGSIYMRPFSFHIRLASCLHENAPIQLWSYLLLLGLWIFSENFWQTSRFVS